MYAPYVSRVFIPLLLLLDFPRHANVSSSFAPPFAPAPYGSAFTQDRERIVVGVAYRRLPAVLSAEEGDGVRR
jgi:dGTP triphosphohydrolase